MEPENTTEDWPHLDGSLKSILANRKSPSDLSRTKYKGLLFFSPICLINSELKILCILKYLEKPVMNIEYILTPARTLSISGLKS